MGLLISARGWSFENPAWESRSKSRETVLLLGGACLLGLAFGSTELAIFYGAIGLGMLNGWILFVRKKLDVPVLLVSVIGAGFGLLGILAPGNFLRSNTYELAHDVDRLLRLTPLYQVWFLGSFLSLPLALFAIVAGGKYDERIFPVSISLQGRWARWIPAALFLFLMLLTLYRDWETDRKSTRLNSSHLKLSRMPSSA